MKRWQLSQQSNDSVVPGAAQLRQHHKNVQGVASVYIDRVRSVDADREPQQVVAVSVVVECRSKATRRFVFVFGFAELRNMYFRTCSAILKAR